jgi:hypothetical protein
VAHDRRLGTELAGSACGHSAWAGRTRRWSIAFCACRGSDAGSVPALGDTCLAGISPEPGSVSRLGPITPMQSRQLAELASRDPAVEWRVILTNAAGQARAVARIPRPRAGPGHRSGPGRREGPGRQEEPQSVGGGPTSRVTLTVSESTLDEESPPGGAETGGILAAALRAASRARARADTDDVADAAAGGCAHLSATTSYRPPPSLRDYVAARDVTCRYPTCRRPAWHGDLDHTLAYEDGGRTCKCNMGGLCREHHLLKQNPLLGSAAVRTRDLQLDHARRTPPCRHARHSPRLDLRGQPGV